MGRLLVAALVGLLLGTTAFAQSDDKSPPGPDRVGAPRSDPIRVAEIQAMPAGSWLHYGRPWRDIDPGRGDNCGVDFSSVLGAWNGVLWDGRYVWNWAGGGHGDGCFNGIVRYDLETGTPEMVVPHLPLNVPFCRGPFTKANGEEDCFWEPYVSDQPHPGGMEDVIIAATEPPGNFLRPRSSHIYNNMVRIGDYIYLMTGGIYISGKRDSQVWRFNAAAADIAATIERLPDRFDPSAGPDVDGNGQPDGDQFGGYNTNVTVVPGKGPLMFGGSQVCQADFAAGVYNCVRHRSTYNSGGATMAWDEERQGFWVVDSQVGRLSFNHEVDGEWVPDDRLSVTDKTLLGKYTIKKAGLCLVPTDNGVNPVIWGANATLIRWDGTRLTTVEGQAGQPTASAGAVLNKWTWNEDLGVCWGTWAVDEGIWVYKPDFANAGTGGNAGAGGNAETNESAAADQSRDIVESGGGSEAKSQSTRWRPPLGLPPTPTPNTLLENNPLSERNPTSSETAQAPAGTAELNPGREGKKEEKAPSPKEPAGDQKEEAVNLKERWWTDSVDYPAFAGHRVAPAPWQPAPWDQPIERQPEAPDYDALCPGPWAEVHYRSDADLAGSDAQMRSIVRNGSPNVRVYLHPRVDATGQVVAYTNRIKFDEVQCSEIVGVPLNGEKPQMMDSVSAGGVGIIARGIMFQTKGVRWSGNAATNTFPAFVVLHDLDIYAAGSLMGVSSPKAPLTYLEFRGNVIGNNTDWHVLYLERSVGQLVALGNIFFGSGRGKHAFKNLAHQSRIEGNVFSNVGIDGQVLAKDRRGRQIVGLMPLDLYLCTETVFRNNTIIFRTSDAVRAFMAYRGRRAWGNCDKGRHLEDGRWELWPPENPEYDEPDKWAEIAAATAAFEQGYEAAKAEPWLFTHMVEGNTFIVFNAQDCGDEPCDNTRAAQVVSLRPVADNRVKPTLRAEFMELAHSCGQDMVCLEAGMSEGLHYAYDHISDGHRRSLIETGGKEWPSGVPIPAPEGWVERSGIFWGANRFITCSAAGNDCRETAPRPVDAAPRPWDDLEVAHPPRVIMQ